MNESAGSNYQVIARRYRPRFFREVVGQEAIAETLQHAIEKDRLAHAYLFCGPRGVGKTSMARIFARTLQCPVHLEGKSPTGEACDGCDTCQRIFRGEDFDVVEMDGASNRGIDDIRDLIHNVRFAPTAARYRIFIIDEVHMLTREAFNALLKTLEEPPAHVKFIFATTEPEKVLPTVLSRCQRCDFSSISVADIVRRLGQICESEGATPEEGLLERIADLARGGMRDSQSLLDQILSFAGTEPTSDDLNRITGRLAPKAISALVDQIDGGDRAGVVSALIEIEKLGTEPSIVLEQVVDEVRQRLHRGVASGCDDAVIERNLLMQEILQEARFRMKQIGRAEILLEVSLLRAATLSDLVPISRWADDLEAGNGTVHARGGGGSAPSGGRASPGRGSSGGGRADGAPSRPLENRADAPPSIGAERAAAPPPSSEPVEIDPGPLPQPPTEPAPAAAPDSASSGRADGEAGGGSPDLAGVRACMAQVSNVLAGVIGDRVSVDGHRVRFSVDSGARRLVEPKVEAFRSELARRFGAPFVIEFDGGAAPASDAGVSGTPVPAPSSPPASAESPPRSASQFSEPPAGPPPSFGPPEPTDDGPPFDPSEAPYEDPAGGVMPEAEPQVPSPHVRLPSIEPLEVATPEIVEKAVEIFRGKLHSARPPMDPDHPAG